MPEDTTTTEATPATDGAQTTTPPSDGASTTPSAPTVASGETVSMTRAELDRMMADARRSAERSAKESQEIKDLRARAKKADDLEAAQLSESERLTKERDDFKTQAETIAAKARTALIRAEFMVQAPTKGIPTDRIKAAMRLADFATVAITDDDEVSGLDAVLDAVIQEHPFLIEKAKTPVPDINAGGGTTITDPAAREADIRSRFRLNR